MIGFLPTSIVSGGISLLRAWAGALSAFFGSSDKQFTSAVHEYSDGKALLRGTFLNSYLKPTATHRHRDPQTRQPQQRKDSLPDRTPAILLSSEILQNSLTHHDKLTGGDETDPSLRISWPEDTGLEAAEIAARMEPLFSGGFPIQLQPRPGRRQTANRRYRFQGPCFRNCLRNSRNRN